MIHEYNARSNSSNKQGSIMNVDALAKLEPNVMSDVIPKGWIINTKNTVIERLLEENEKLRKKCNNAENRLGTTDSFLNQLEQYERRNNIFISGIPVDISDNQLKEVEVKIFADIDDNVEASDFNACHRFGKSDREWHSKKQ